MSILAEPLARTLLLMRDEIRAEATDATLLDALTTTEIVVTGDCSTLASHAAQTAFVTIAMLCARSGHKVYLAAPDVSLVGPQPLLSGKTLISGLMELDGRIVPAPCFMSGVPHREIDLEIRLGTIPSLGTARRSLALSATTWDAHLAPSPRAAWPDGLSWPLGAMAGAAVVAAEAFNIAMRKVRMFARSPVLFDDLFAPIADTRVTLAPATTPTLHNLGLFDLISGGAISHAVLYAVAHIPAVRGVARVLEPDIAEFSNLNRYALLLTDHIGFSKSTQLAELPLGGLTLIPAPVRYENAATNGPLAKSVLVGVDHIPTRWNVQRAQPNWLGVGATTHWSAMASFHKPGNPCAACLHPYDDPTDGPIPTVAFVSFMAGLQLASYFLQSAGDGSPSSQQTYITMPRPNSLWRGPVAWHPRCPVGHGVGQRAA